MFDLIIEEHKTYSNSAALSVEMTLMIKYNRWRQRNPDKRRPMIRHAENDVWMVQAYLTFETEEEAVLYKLANWESYLG